MNSTECTTADATSLHAGEALAGKSTLNRLELTPAGADEDSRCKKIVMHTERLEALFVDVFLQAHAAPPSRIVLDVDSTFAPLHGHQLGRFFHGYYDCCCYLPLYVFCGEHLLAARLRPSDIDGAAVTLELVRRIVARIRAAWPNVEIVLRGDSGSGSRPWSPSLPRADHGVVRAQRRGLSLRPGPQRPALPHHRRRSARGEASA